MRSCRGLALFRTDKNWQPGVDILIKGPPEAAPHGLGNTHRGYVLYWVTAARVIGEGFPEEMQLP
jgi:hypothetical protein